MNGVYDPDETGVVDLSEVVDKTTYIILTSSKLILARLFENFCFLTCILNVLFHVLLFNINHLTV